MRQILMIIPAIALLVSCMGQDGASPEGAASGSADVEFKVFTATGDGTRSSVTAPEDGIYNLLVLFYEDGQLLPELTESRSAGGADGLDFCVSLGIGHDYEVAAFANCTVSPAPQTIAEARALCYDCDGIGGWSAGIPMAGYKSLTVRYGMSSVSMQLVRLVARLDLTIDTSPLRHGSIQFTSIAVRQMNRSCPFFGTGCASAAGGVCDGDLASPSDLQRLNASGAGYSTSFYLLENMQGDILGGNTDPDAKVPSQVSAAGSDPGLCTYLEILGTYSDRSGHLTSDELVSHLFLGRDALGNFDLARNNRYTVSVRITDEGCLRTDWKIDGRLEDSRTLAFASSNLTVGKNASVDAVLNTNLSLSQGDYSYSVSGDTGFFTVVPVSNGFRVTSANNVVNGKSIQISAVSWDGALRTNCTVTATFASDTRFELDWDGELYVGQKGTIRFYDKNGQSLAGRTQVIPSSNSVRVSGSGDTWYVYALGAVVDNLMLLVDTAVAGFVAVPIVNPVLRFPSEEVFLPLDGATVECGPFYYTRDGERLRYEDFDPDLYHTYLGITVERHHDSNTYAGRYWGRHYSDGNPAVDEINTGGDHDSFSYRIGRLSYIGRTIANNYDFTQEQVKLEYLTARSDLNESAYNDTETVLYTADPFPESVSFGAFSSQALETWLEDSTHDEIIDLETAGLLKEGNDCSYASAVASENESYYSFSFPDRNTLQMTVLYDTYGPAAMPLYSFSIYPSIINRVTGERYTSSSELQARFTVKIGVGGRATANASGGSDVSVEWTCPRQTDDPLASLEGVVVGTGGDSYVQGLYTNLYSRASSPAALRNAERPSFIFCQPWQTPSGSNTSTSDWYTISSYYGQGYRFEVTKYSRLYPASNGWLDR